MNDQLIPFQKKKKNISIIGDEIVFRRLFVKNTALIQIVWPGFELMGAKELYMVTNNFVTIGSGQFKKIKN